MLKDINDEWLRVSNFIVVCVSMDTTEREVFRCGPVHINLARHCMETNLVIIVIHSWTCRVSACLPSFVNVSPSAQLIIVNWSLVDHACERSLPRRKNLMSIISSQCQYRVNDDDWLSRRRALFVTILESQPNTTMSCFAQIIFIAKNGIVRALSELLCPVPEPIINL